MLEFKNKILFVGYGAVAQCALPILVKHLKTPGQKHHGHGFRGPARHAVAVD